MESHHPRHHHILSHSRLHFIKLVTVCRRGPSLSSSPTCLQIEPATTPPSNRSRSTAGLRCQLHIRPESPQRVALHLQYNGAAFHGWQRNPHVRSVQKILEQALSLTHGHDVSLTAASRTDAGAHALAQVVHFDTPSPLSSPTSCRRAVNSRLPDDVRITTVTLVPPGFDVRRNAVARTYRYSILATDTPSVFLSPFVWHVRSPHHLDIAAMHCAVQSLTTDPASTRDLRAFRKQHADATHTRISVTHASVNQQGPLVHVDVTASWFVYGMMRLLTATLIQVGLHRMPVHEFVRIVRSGDRHAVRESAPAAGLCLMRVHYGEASPFPPLLETPVHPCIYLSENSPTPDDMLDGDGAALLPTV